MPEPPPWGADRLVGYEALVQPVLDRRCTSCHGREKPDGGLDFSATRSADGFFQSFRTMFGLAPDGEQTDRVLVSCSDRFSNSSASKPKQFGSHKSPLIRVLLRDPLHVREVRLDDDEWLTLVAWVDANAPYHDKFYNKRPSDGSQPKRDVAPPLAPPTAAK